MTRIVAAVRTEVMHRRGQENHIVKLKVRRRWAGRGAATCNKLSSIALYKKTMSIRRAEGLWL